MSNGSKSTNTSHLALVEQLANVLQVRGLRLPYDGPKQQDGFPIERQHTRTRQKATNTTRIKELTVCSGP